jgi:hypothetical protein
VKHGRYSVQESYPMKAGAFGRLAQRIAWGLVRPFIDDIVRQADEQTGELREECANLRSDLLATNYRITWLEDQIAKSTPARRERS